MKKIFLLILFTFLLNSCSGIKIIIEKDCDCKCDNKQTTESSSLNNFNEENNKQNLTENIDKPELLRYLT
jgi:hypothetical protein